MKKRDFKVGDPVTWKGDKPWVYRNYPDRMVVREIVWGVVDWIVRFEGKSSGCYQYRLTHANGPW